MTAAIAERSQAARSQRIAASIRSDFSEVDFKSPRLMTGATMVGPMVSANRVPTNFVGNISNDNAEKAEFAGLIRLYSDRKVAKAADVSEETVRLWKGERRFPQGHNLMKLMAEFPKVASWVNRRTGGMNNPRSVTEGFALLEQVMVSATPEGRAMRARLMQIMAERNG